MTPSKWQVQPGGMRAIMTAIERRRLVSRRDLAKGIAAGAAVLSSGGFASADALNTAQTGVAGTRRKIGRQSSNGCIGLYNEHIEEVFDRAAVGTRVKLI